MTNKQAAEDVDASNDDDDDDDEEEEEDDDDNDNDAGPQDWYNEALSMRWA
jgi:hypothetical protein